MKSSARRKIIQDDEQKRTFSSRAAFLWENIYPAVFAGLGTMPSNRENRFSLTASMVRENRKKICEKCDSGKSIGRCSLGPENPFPDFEIDRPLLPKGAHNLPHHGTGGDQVSSKH